MISKSVTNIPSSPIMSTASVSNSDLLLLSLTNYYTKHKKHLNIFKDIVENNSKLSLRLIDWYVTNYCKEHNIAYVLTKYGKQEYFNVYMNYRSQLKAFKKVLFDPFRRRSRITFYYDKKNYIHTTIGQLNFFRWAIENDIISNLTVHLQDVEQDMMQSNRRIVSSDTTEKKGQKLSSSHTGSSKRTTSSAHRASQNSVRVSSKGTTGSGFKSSIKTMTKFTGNTLISFR